MLNSVLSEFYEKDIRKWIEEIGLFNEEENLWKTAGSVKNSAGNLALHIIGGTNFLIGTALAQTGYVRNRDQELIQKDVERKVLIAQLEELIPMFKSTINTVDLNAEYPGFFDKPHTTNGYVLVRLLAHLDYHLGQVNYLRRILE